MRLFGATISLFFSFLLFPTFGTGQNSQPAESSASNHSQDSAAAVSSFEEAVDRMLARERSFNRQIRNLHPLIETYIQNLRNDDQMGPVPVSDRYFLGRLDLSGRMHDPFAHDAEEQAFLIRLNVLPKINELYAVHFLPGGFAQMVLVDQDFDRQHYTFNYVRREFLGETRCLVMDVHPKKHSGKGRFVGRIWVEDQDYNVVRFNGTYTNRSLHSDYFHFDSWRLNLRPGVWLPGFIYSEETDAPVRMSQSLHFKAQSRLWGYELAPANSNSAFTEIVVDTAQSIRDQSGNAQDASPVQSERMWERQAEDNAIERLQKAGLMAPEGEVDKVMQTVVNNLIFTNNLNIQPEVRTRVLLTTPLESFTIGHTIVLSRGLLDVLPDEATLAMILAHELGHIALGHRLDTKFAFNDRMFFPDQSSFARLNFTRDFVEERAADRKAVDLLSNSPYKDKLADTGLFLRALLQSTPQLKNLIRPHLGSTLASKDGVRMTSLMNSAPSLATNQINQIAALPLGARIRLDPWTSQIELIKGKPVALTTSREKMPFEITPFFPYLTRFSSAGRNNEALTTPVK